MGPLKGIRIVDMTSVVMGPFATTVLGDLGADVIKVENVDGGDTIRKVGPSRSGAMGGLFMHANRSKRSIAVDLKSPAGLEIALRLAQSADVFFYNIRPKAMDRLGLSYEKVRAVNPAIIYAGAFGYGQEGRYRDDPAYDDLIQGLSGIPSLVADAGAGEPRYVPVNIADRLVGLYAGNAILAAVLHRNATGEGQKVDIPMFETMASVVLGDHLGGRTYVPPLDGGGYVRLLSSARVPYRTADGYLCILPYSERHRHDLAWMLEKIGETDGPLIDMLRHDHPSAAINSEMARLVVRRTTDCWRRHLDEFDIPNKPLHSIDTLVEDPHLADSGFFVNELHPIEGPVISMKVPSTWERTQPSDLRPAPGLGEHTREILKEITFSDEAIDGLAARGVVFDGSTTEPRKSAAC